MTVDPEQIAAYRRLMAQVTPGGQPVARYVRKPDRVPDRCLVLDAAFNPPTRAHQALALTGAEAAGADGIFLQLAGANVDKGITGADLGERLVMLDAIASKDPRFGVVACSHARFVDKADALRALCPETAFVFAIGYDTLVRLFDPKYYDDMTGALNALFAAAEFAVANRGDDDEAVLDDYLATSPAADYADRIHKAILPPGLADVSSSRVRDGRARGEDVSHLVPPGVMAVISVLGLYTQKARD